MNLKNSNDSLDPFERNPKKAYKSKHSNDKGEDEQPFETSEEEEEEEETIEETNDASSRNRTKKTDFQLDILNGHFKLNETWSRSLITEIAAKTNLKPTQVYKWYWDQKLKETEKMRQGSGSGASGLENKRFFNKKTYSEMLKNHEIYICKEFLLPEDLLNKQSVKDFLL